MSKLVWQECMHKLQHMKYLLGGNLACRKIKLANEELSSGITGNTADSMTIIHSIDNFSDNISIQCVSFYTNYNTAMHSANHVQVNIITYLLQFYPELSKVYFGIRDI